MIHIPHVQAVAFDLDGTLVDSVPDLAAAANEMRAVLGMERLPEATVRSYVGDGIAVLVHRALTDNEHGQADLPLFERGSEVFLRYYADHIADQTRPYPETEAGLGLLKSLGIPLAVVTNKSDLLAIKLLKALKLEQYFSIVVGGDTLNVRKPSGEPLRHVAGVLGIQTQNMLMVGDSRNDMLAAKDAGCPVAGVTFGYGDMAALSENEATKPDWLIGSLVEIYNQLEAEHS